MSIKHRLQYNLNYTVYALSIAALVVFTTQAMHDQDFTQYLTAHFGITLSDLYAEDYTAAKFYKSTAHELQQKTLYELVVLAHTHSQLLASTHYEDLLPVKQAIQVLIQEAIEHAVVTQNDIKQFATLTDPEIMRYALSVLNPLQKDNSSDKYSLYVNKLILMLRLKLKQAISTPSTTIQSKKAPLRACRSRPSADWIVINNNTSEELYQEVKNEMVDTVILTEDFLKKNNLQQEVIKQRIDLEHTQDTLTEEYSITRSIEHELLKILQDYQNTSPLNAQVSLTQALESLAQQRQTREEELATKIQQKKLLEQTSEQLRGEIASIAQVILDKVDSTTHRLQAIEGEKRRLSREKQELIKEQASTQARLAYIDTHLSKLDTTEQRLLEKQVSHKKAKKALATAHFTCAVKEGKLLPH